MSVNPKIEPSWLEVLRPQFEAPYFQQLKDFLVDERSRYVCYPRGCDIFAAFNRTPFDKVRVVILGQDPYHEPGQAQGLCFSVPDGVAVPPSLVNIIKEINADLGTDIGTNHGDLGAWADAGVLLLNATLTVRAHKAGSHQGHGWEQFTDAAISALSQHRNGIVFEQLYSCSGAPTPYARRPSSTPRATTSSPRRTPRHCRPTAAFSAADISRRPTKSSPRRVCLPYLGPTSGKGNRKKRKSKSEKRNQTKSQPIENQ